MPPEGLARALKGYFRFKSLVFASNSEGEEHGKEQDFSFIRSQNSTYR